MTYFQNSITALIKTRRSCRSFSSTQIGSDPKQSLSNFAALCSNEMFRFQLLEKMTGPEAKKLGTYGVVSNCNLFIAGIIKKGSDMFEFGAVGETLVLYASDLGLSSCWIGGSFDRKSFSEQLDVAKDEYVPLVIPVGYPAAKPRFIEKVMRAFVSADKRKEWGNLFFDSSFQKGLTPSAAGDYRSALESLRLAPSAINKQPWRVLKDNKGFHFYLNRSKGFGSYGYDMQMIDMGIGFAHFALTSRENHLRGTISENAPQSSPGYEYVRSWLF